MPVGPFVDADAYRHWAEAAARSADPLHYAVVDRTTGDALGTLALMRIDAPNGVIEVGCVAFSPAMQRTLLSTEAHYLLMKLVFDELGYRRYEWKCDSLNAPSRQAALRLGFSFEGMFRQAVVYKGRFLSATSTVRLHSVPTITSSTTWHCSTCRLSCVWTVPDW
jgi:RimJ/RimL family protein N-acetyltransferase